MTKGAESKAYVTLVTDDSSAQGALVLGHSLRTTATPHQLVTLVTDTISPDMRGQLEQVFDLVQEVHPEAEEARVLMHQDPALCRTLVKVHSWTLTQFSKVVFLDNDTLVLKSCDELFDWDELSASPDSGWPDLFNTGVLVLKPALSTFQALLSAVVASPRRISSDGGDQSLLNQHFQEQWSTDLSRHLPFIYNMASSTATVYTYLPAYLRNKDQVKIIRFGGLTKPWMLSGSPSDSKPATGTAASVYTEHAGLWWDIYQDKVVPPESKEGSPADFPTAEGSPTHTEQARKQAWESGHMDYLGADCFDNIQRRLDAIINNAE